jgi:hypothetical protein
VLYYALLRSQPPKAFRLLQLQETSEGKVFPSERVLEKLEELEKGYSNEATARAKFSELL